MIPPVRKGALSERSLTEEQDELEASRAETISERIELALELSELSREAAEQLRAPWLEQDPRDLADKAVLYALPLRVAAKR